MKKEWLLPENGYRNWQRKRNGRHPGGKQKGEKYGTYLLTNGKYVLDEFYALPPDNFGITDKEREESKKEIPVSLYDNFCIPLKEIFDHLF